MASCSPVSRALIGYQPRAKPRGFPGICFQGGEACGAGWELRPGLPAVLALPPTGETPLFLQLGLSPSRLTGSGLAAAPRERPHTLQGGAPWAERFSGLKRPWPCYSSDQLMVLCLQNWDSLKTARSEINWCYRVDCFKYKNVLHTSRLLKKRETVESRRHDLFTKSVSIQDPGAKSRTP